MVKRIRNEEKGFTLIELLVVILIIGILLAIAAPSFLGQQNKAYDSKAKQALAVGYKEAKAYNATAQGSFGTTGAILSQITNGEPQLSALATNSTVSASPADVLFVIQASNGTLGLAYQSQSGATCTLAVTNNQAPVYTGC